MFRPRLVIAGLALGLFIAAPHAGAQVDPGFSVTLDLEPEMTPQEKIAALNNEIMTMQAAGKLTPELGDLFNDLGVRHAQLEEWPEARMAFIRAVQIKSYDPDFHRNLALVALNLEDYDLALSEFEEYKTRGGPQAIDVHRRLGQTYLKMNEIDSARTAYNEGLEALGGEARPEVCRLALALAALENEHGNSEDMRKVLQAWQPVARKWRETAVETGIDDGVDAAETIEANLLSVIIEDGQLLEEAGLAAEAAELYEQAYELAPDRHELLPRLVSAYLAGGDTFHAKVRARLARQDTPEEAGAWVASAQVYEAEGQNAEALEAYAQAYELAPDTPGLRLKLGNLYIEQGRAVEGRRVLSDAIEQDETPTEVVYNYAVSLMKEKKFSAALAPMRRVTRELPEFAGGWQALAQCYRARKQYDEAIAAYEKALALAPDPRTAYNLGVTAGRAGEWAAAVEAYDQALALAPGNLESAYNRAVALMRGGRLQEADTAFASYHERDPGHYKASLNHGVTLYKLGRYDEAVEIYNATLEIKETAEAWDNLGLAYQEQGQKKKAQACFREAKTLRGES